MSKHRPTEYRFTFTGNKDRAAAARGIGKTLLRILQNKAAFADNQIRTLTHKLGDVTFTVTKHFNLYHLHIDVPEGGEKVPWPARPSYWFGPYYVTMNESDNTYEWTELTNTIGGGVVNGFALQNKDNGITTLPFAEWSFHVDGNGYQYQQTKNPQDTSVKYACDDIFDILNDCATDGIYLYLSGPTSGYTKMGVQKINLIDNSTVWAKEYLNYNGGGITIAANPLGFALYCNERVEFFDPDGVSQAVRSSESIGTEWALCATKDRFFIPTFPAPNNHVNWRCYSLDGTLHYTVVPTQSPEADGWFHYPVVTENHFYIFNAWKDIVPTTATASVTIFDRNVVRDSAGNIVSDSVDMGSRVLVNFQKGGANVEHYGYKGSVDTLSFIQTEVELP